MQGDFPIPRRPVVDLKFIRSKRVYGPGVLGIPERRFTTSGRAAMGLALQHCGVLPGDRVLVPTYHCPTMIAPVVRSGASLAWYPLTAAGYPYLEFLRRTDTSGVRAMIAAHYFGFWGPMDDVARFCDERGIALIEDGAHCLLAPLGHRNSTSGHFVIGSLTKCLPVSKGGILASCNAPLAVRPAGTASASEALHAAWDIVDLAASAGRLGPATGAVRAVTRFRRRNAIAGGATPGHERKDPIEDWLADTLLEDGALSVVDRWLVEHSDYDRLSRARYAAYEQISAGLRATSGLRLLRPDAGLAPPYVLPVQFEGAEPVYQSLRSKGLPVFRWDQRWPGTPDLDQDVGREWARTVVQIACHQSLDAHQIERIIDAVQRSVADAGPHRR